MLSLHLSSYHLYPALIVEHCWPFPLVYSEFYSSSESSPLLGAHQQVWCVLQTVSLFSVPSQELRLNSTLSHIQYPYGMLNEMEWSPGQLVLWDTPWIHTGELAEGTKWPSTTFSFLDCPFLLQHFCFFALHKLLNCLF